MQLHKLSSLHTWWWWSSSWT